MSTLDLTTSYRTAVYRVLRAAIEDDEVYSRAGIALQFYDGDPRILADQDTEAVPSLRFFPELGEMSWYTETSANGALIVHVEARLAALDMEDVFDLQETLESTLNTINDPSGLQTDLVSAGATTGLVLFDRPLNVSGRLVNDNLIRLSGQFIVEVLRPLGP